MRKQLDWVVEAEHRIFADAFEIEIAFDEVSERAGQQHRSAQLFGEGFETRSMLTAGPMTVKSSRVRGPILPYMTSPT